MSVGYTSVQWNSHKKLYDAVLAGVLLLSLGAFVVVSLLTNPHITAETLILRSTAVAAFLLLHVILCIGPLARLDRRFLPLLYNRRHLGVTMFFLGLVHATLALIQFHVLGPENPFLNVLAAYAQDYSLTSLAHFPFEVFGAGALLILFFMAATSHDFWNRNLGPSFWKTLHVLVLVAYAFLVLHVALGALQSERSVVYPVLLGVGVLTVLGLHIAAAVQESRIDRQRAQARTDAEQEGFVRACRAEEVVEGRGKVVVISGERLAVFRHDDKLFAMSNVCRHQGGPLGEGKIIDGCVTCPWHGWQYRAEDGCSPPPFTEVVPTYRLRLVENDGKSSDVYLHPEPLELQVKSDGVPAPSDLAEAASAAGTSPNQDDPFYVGYLALPAGLKRHLVFVGVLLAVLLPVVSAIIAHQQRELETGVFEFGVQRTFEGVLYETPVTLLHLTTPTDDPEAETAGLHDGRTELLISGFGKNGLPPWAQGNHGQKVRFDGSLIYRQGLTMVEMNDEASFEVLGAPAAEERLPPASKLGGVELVGELVDTKCYLGVMRPGTGKVHRACAILCLTGGVPPGLLVRGTDGTDVVYLLAGQPGEKLDYQIPWAGRLIQVRGELEVHGETPVIRVEEMELTDG